MSFYGHFHGQVHSQKQQINLHCAGARKCLHPVTPLSGCERRSSSLLCFWVRQMQYLANTELNLGFGDRIFFFHLVLLLLGEWVCHRVCGAALTLR